MYKSRYNMAVLQIVVVMGTIDICWDHTGEHAPMLLVVGSREGGGGGGERLESPSQILIHTCMHIQCTICRTSWLHYT